MEFLIDWSSRPAVERSPERVSGAWVFRGTRVPIAALFENLEDDITVQGFIELFPGVTLDQARADLEHAARSSLAVAQVRVAFDQGVPAPLRRLLTGHSVATAYELGWSTLSNGGLIRTAEAAGYEVLVTTDTSLKDQQNLTSRRIAIVVLTTTRWPRIRLAAEAIGSTIEAARMGGYVEVAIA